MGVPPSEPRRLSPVGKAVDGVSESTPNTPSIPNTPGIPNGNGAFRAAAAPSESPSGGQTPQHMASSVTATDDQVECLTAVFDQFTDHVRKMAVVTLQREKAKKEMDKRELEFKKSRKHHFAFASLVEQQQLSRSQAQKRFEDLDRQFTDHGKAREKLSRNIASKLLSQSKSQPDSKLDSKDADAIQRHEQAFRETQKHMKAIKTFTGQVSSLQGRADGTKIDMKMAQNDVRKVQSDVKNTQIDFKNAQADVINAQIDVKNAQIDIKSVQSDLADMRSRVNHVEGVLQNLPGRLIDIPKLIVDIHEIRGSLQSLRTHSSEAKSEFDNLKDEIRKMEGLAEQVHDNTEKRKKIALNIAMLDQDVESHDQEHQAFEDRIKDLEGNAVTKADWIALDERIKSVGHGHGHGHGPGQTADLEVLTARLKSVEERVQQVAETRAGSGDTPGSTSAVDGEAVATLRRELEHFIKEQQERDDLVSDEIATAQEKATKANNELGELSRTYDVASRRVDDWTSRFERTISEIQQRLAQSNHPTQQTETVPQAPSVAGSGDDNHTQTRQMIKDLQEQVKTHHTGIAQLWQMYRTLNFAVENLDSRFNKLTTEELARYMVKQMSEMYPNASNIQASFDQVKQEALATKTRVEELAQKVEELSAPSMSPARPEAASSGRVVNGGASEDQEGDGPADKEGYARAEIDFKFSKLQTDLSDAIRFAQSSASQVKELAEKLATIADSAPKYAEVKAEVDALSKETSRIDKLDGVIEDLFYGTSDKIGRMIQQIENLNKACGLAGVRSDDSTDPTPRGTPHAAGNSSGNAEGDSPHMQQQQQQQEHEQEQASGQGASKAHPRPREESVRKSSVNTTKTSTTTTSNTAHDESNAGTIKRKRPVGRPRKSTTSAPRVESDASDTPPRRSKRTRTEVADRGRTRSGKTVLRSLPPRQARQPPIKEDRHDVEEDDDDDDDDGDDSFVTDVHSGRYKKYHYGDDLSE